MALNNAAQVEMDTLLDNVVKIINEANGNGNQQLIETCFKKLAVAYRRLELQNVDILQEFDQYFVNDTELYILILSLLIVFYKKKEFYDKVEELLEKGKLPFHDAIGIYQQMRIQKFHYHVESNSYQRNREILKNLMEQAKKEYGLPSYEKKHGQNKRIVLLTDTLLSEYHAPTRIVLDLCKTLQEEMGYQVLAVVCVENVDVDALNRIWMEPYKINFIHKKDKLWKQMHHGCEISVYQQECFVQDKQEVRDLFQYVYDWNPDFIWKIGVNSPILELFADIAPMVSMPCTDGYAISFAPVMISYMRNDDEKVKEMREVLKADNQDILDIQIQGRVIREEGELSLGDIGAKVDDFLIAIVGNRLDEELSPDFLKIMKKILEKEEKAKFVIIGRVNDFWVKGIFENRVINLGFRKDLVNVLKLCQLFLNPPRQGGGGGAVRAIISDTPVITLDNCDCALVGKDFICDSVQEFPSLVSRYCHDEKFYNQQVEHCKEQAKKREQVDNIREYQRVIEFVEKEKKLGKFD